MTFPIWLKAAILDLQVYKHRNGPNDESYIRNEFYMPKLVTIEVLHVKMVQETKKMTFPTWPSSAILDLERK